MAYLDAVNDPEKISEKISTFNVHNIGTIATTIERVAAMMTGGWKPSNLGEFEETVRRVVREEVAKRPGATSSD